jgi:hypothetical protein
MEHCQLKYQVFVFYKASKAWTRSDASYLIIHLKKTCCEVFKVTSLSPHVTWKQLCTQQPNYQGCNRVSAKYMEKPMQIALIQNV